MKIKMLFSYDGSPFCGWQKQPSGLPSVQGHLEEALSSIFGESIQVVASGRTDAGVHALGQVAHLSTNKDIKKYNIIRAVNSLTPDEIVVKQAWKAPDDFHAIGSCAEKIYRYVIHNSPIPHAFHHKYAAWVRQPLNVQKLNAMAQILVGTHDFKSFQTRGTETPSTIRTISAVRWRQLPNNKVDFTIKGDGFLKQMVRNVVGAQLDLLRHSGSEQDFREILAARDRTAALGTAPAQGLYLLKVIYPPKLDNKCRKI